VLAERLILCIFGYGTNIGLRAAKSATPTKTSATYIRSHPPLACPPPAQPPPRPPRRPPDDRQHRDHGPIRRPAQTRGPQRYGKGGKRIQPAAGNGSSQCWAAARPRRRDRDQRRRHRPRRPPRYPPGTPPGPTVTRASLRADLLAVGERAQLLNSRIRQLQKRLSERSAKRPGRNQVSALLPISATSTRPSVILGSRSPTCAYRRAPAWKPGPVPPAGRGCRCRCRRW